ncbi:MAG: hypothetical protein LT105_01725 [Lentimicrobium sp.]|jgi:hypothetical protein|nr:hypothetical protein [Lentimicrobium sp.]
MNTNRTLCVRTRVALLATAFLVFWIYLGSLINFHQHHIFGRTLIPNGILSKREETITVSQELPSLINFLLPADVPESCNHLPVVEFTDVTIPTHSFIAFISIGIPASHGLRGPPAQS